MAEGTAGSGGAADAALLRGERVAVARALNDAESTKEGAEGRTRVLVARLAASGAVERAHRVGLTGPPGVGKSTLAAALIRVLRARGKTVGVLAVDPSSPRSGGALLGDRVRMATDPADEGVFVRSVATGGELGGLARAVPVSVLLLSAAFDVVLVETVGVGQSETDARHVTDTLVYVVQPGSGDAVQYMKAGIMEVPDLFVVNKADQPAARATARELGAALAALHAAEVAPEAMNVLSVSAATGEGMDALATAVEGHRERCAASGELGRRRADGAVVWGLREVRRRYGEEGLARLGGAEKVREAIGRSVARGGGVLDAVAELNPYARRE